MQVKLLTPSWHRPPLLQGSEKRKEYNKSPLYVRFRLKDHKNLVLTWFAVVNVNLTLQASVPWLAQALVTPHCVVTNGSIVAWVFHTLIDVNLTCLTLKEKGTN